MTNSEKYIVQNKPEYVNKTLLLANRDRNGLFSLPDKSAHILLRFGENGELLVADTFGCQHPNVTLRDIGQHYLHLEDPSIDELLSYLVTPEMEVERIFNAVRFKYLRAIHLSNIKNPPSYLNCTYNKAFQALAGVVVYQGNAIRRKENDAFWQEAGFTVEAKEQNWQKERDELKSILTVLKRITFKPVTRVYAELIAIKPGFHELYLHDDYFTAEQSPGNSPRDRVFQMLRGNGELASLSMNMFPSEMNKRSFFGYAPCHVTEGPFVFRKSLAVSYYDEIRRITSKKQLRRLKDKFHILAYDDVDISTHERLGVFLETAKTFCSYLV